MPCSNEPIKLPKKGYPLRPCPRAAILTPPAPDKFRTAYVPGLPVRRCFEKVSSGNVISGFSETSYLRVPTADVGMTGDFFTVECFVFIPSEGIKGIFGATTWGIAVNSDNIVWNTFSIPKAPYVNKWSHIAAVYTNEFDSTVVYIDGVNVGTYGGGTINPTLYIGADGDGSFLTNGKISNFRVSNYERYNGDFTPSLPLTADANTTLLLTNSLTNDIPGAPVETIGNLTLTSEVISYIPYLPWYGVISGFLETSYLTVPTADVGMTGALFTVECFAFIPETPGIGAFGSGELGIYFTQLYIRWYADFVLKEPYVNKWTHLAVVRNGGENYVYVDGVQVGSYIQPIGPDLLIGGGTGSSGVFTNGKISNFRVSNIARYDEDFTPQLPLVSDANTTLLITDSLSSVTTVGNPIIASELIFYTPYVSP
jgi:hypothetical protein